MATTLPVKTYAVCTGILYVKFLVTSMIQGRKSMCAGSRAPEDAKLPMAAGMPKLSYTQASTQDPKLLRARETEERWRRIVMNDLESIPFALLVFGAGLMVSANERVQVSVMVAYTLARCGHTYAFAHSLQPHRGIFWFTGVISILIAAGNAIAAALQ